MKTAAAFLFLCAFAAAQDETPAGFAKRLAAAQEKLRSGDAAGAETEAAAAVELAPEDWRGHYLHAHACWSQGKFDEAIAGFGSAIEHESANPQVLYDRGRLYMELCRNQEAIADFTKVTHLNASFSGAYLLRAECKARAGDFEGASQDVEAGLYLDTESPQPLLTRGHVRRLQGNAEGALADYTAAIERVSQDAQVYEVRGRFLHDLGRWKESAADLKKAVELEQGDEAYAQLYLYLARARGGEEGAARKDLSAYTKAREADDWPQKLLKTLSGETTGDALIAAAQESDGFTERQRLCEAYFYVGAQRLLAGDGAKARELFGRCVETGVSNFVEYGSAKAELARAQ